MKKALLAFGLVVMSVVVVNAQEGAIETEAVVAAPVETTVLASEGVIEGQAIVGETFGEQIIEGAADMTYTAAPAADCGCSGGSVIQAAPVYTQAAPVYTQAAPVADCGCGSPVVADCGCAAPAPTCCPQPRQRNYAVRSAVRARRNSCCNEVADCGCVAPAPIVADCGCAAPAPIVADCGCAAPAPTCCPQPRQRKYVVRSAVSSRRGSRNCCCN